jgi:hypothetical protein
VSLDGVVEDPTHWAHFDSETRALALDNLRGRQRQRACKLGVRASRVEPGQWSNLYPLLTVSLIDLGLRLVSNGRPLSCECKSV